MSAARLILKQATGWFAAGQEVAQALALLSDGAFKLLCAPLLSGGPAHWSGADRIGRADAYFASL